MSRAAKNALEQQTNKNTAYANDVLGNTKSINDLASGLPSDLTPEQKAAFMRGKVGGIDIGAANAADKAARFSARTGSIAGAPELQTNIERNRARDVATAQGEGELEMASVPFQYAAAKGDLYGREGQLNASLYGPGMSYSGQLAQQAYAPGLFHDLLVGAAKGAAQGATSA